MIYIITTASPEGGKIAGKMFWKFTVVSNFYTYIKSKHSNLNIASVFNGTWDVSRNLDVLIVYTGLPNGMPNSKTIACEYKTFVTIEILLQPKKLYLDNEDSYKKKEKKEV